MAIKIINKKTITSHIKNDIGILNALLFKITKTTTLKNPYYKIKAYSSFDFTITLLEAEEKEIKTNIIRTIKTVHSFGITQLLEKIFNEHNNKYIYKIKNIKFIGCTGPIVYPVGPIREYTSRIEYNTPYGKYSTMKATVDAVFKRCTEIKNNTPYKSKKWLLEKLHNPNCEEYNIKKIKGYYGRILNK